MSARSHPAIILFAHGARDPEWAQPLAGIKGRIERTLPDVPVALAYLELMSPTLDQAVEALVADGADSIDVVPVFMARAGHVKRDLPLLIDALKSAHPSVAIHLAPAVGEADAVMDAIAHWVVSLAQRPSA
jgi:sirohydrochlorin cobaltochelatase